MISASELFVPIIPACGLKVGRLVVTIILADGSIVGELVIPIIPFDGSTTFTVFTKTLSDI